MVTVAILGILASIAIPTYQKFKQRALRAEVEANLAGIFQVEVSFFAERARFGSLSEIGFVLAGVTNRYTYRSPAPGSTAGSTGTVNVDLLNPAVGPSFPENTVTPSGATAGGGHRFVHRDRHSEYHWRDRHRNGTGTGNPPNSELAYHD